MSETLALNEVKTLALQAYMKVWREHHIGLCPPPGQCRDKKWSKVLRELWPECTSIKLDATTKSNVGASHADITEWCRQQKSSNYWVNGGGNIWYFERRDIAALFKLQFGGDEQ